MALGYASWLTVFVVPLDLEAAVIYIEPIARTHVTEVGRAWVYSE